MSHDLPIEFDEMAFWSEPPPAVPGPAPVAEGIVPLGHDRGSYFYLSQSTRQVAELQASQHSKNALMSMASLTHYWEHTRFKKEKGGIEWDAAVDDLMSKCRAVGIYNPARIRGRGAWMDDGRALLHLGDKILMDGEEYPLIVKDSPHIYEAALPFAAVHVGPLTKHEAHELVKICEQLRWERGVSGVLLAGFLAVAPICGGLVWRPSIWVTGSSGSGKSWLKDNIMAPILGNIALLVQSKTSEAGIRQALGSDARPVLFDEAEREDAASATRMQAVMDLVRQSASEGGAEILKGTSSQSGPKRYRVRSCFAFSSINVGLEHQADESRISVLPLKDNAGKTPEARADSNARFEALNAHVERIITPDFSAGLIARSVKMLPLIRKNAETFARAVALHLGSRRLGDQVGTLLSGAYSLHSDGIISDEDAMRYIQRHDWSGAASSDAETDECRLVSHVTQHRIRISLGNMGTIDCQIARLIDAAAYGRDPQIVQEVAQAELRAIGIKYGRLVPSGEAGLHISTSHPELKRILSGTPWSAGWGRSFARLPGASSSTGKAVRFSTGHMAKAAWVPLTSIDIRDEGV